MRTGFPLVWFVFLTAFLPAEPKTDTLRPVPSFIHPAELNVTLNYFDEKMIPGQIGGDCSERYAFDTVALRMGKMVLFTDFDTVIMKINYKLIFFKISYTQLKGKQRVTVFSGQGYTGRFTSKQIKKIADEYFIQSGVIEISRNGLKKLFYVTGNYGC